MTAKKAPSVVSLARHNILRDDCEALQKRVEELLNLRDRLQSQAVINAANYAEDVRVRDMEIRMLKERVAAGERLVRATSIHAEEKQKDLGERLRASGQRLEELRHLVHMLTRQLLNEMGPITFGFSGKDLEPKDVTYDRAQDLQPFRRGNDYG